MTTALDTNVVSALWDKDPILNLAARTALERAFRRGGLVVAAPVFSELMAAPGRSESFVSSFFEDTGVAVDGNSANRYGAWQEEHFRLMRSGGAISEHGALSRTS